MIYLRCPGCGKEYQVRDEYAGYETPCTQCGQALLVPEAGAEEAAEAVEQEASGPAVEDLTSTGLDLGPGALTGALLGEEFGTAPLAPGMSLCAGCRREIPEVAVLCVHCGFDRRKGKRLARGGSPAAEGLEELVPVGKRRGKVHQAARPRVVRGLGLLSGAVRAWAAIVVVTLIAQTAALFPFDLGPWLRLPLGGLAVLGGGLLVAGAALVWAAPAGGAMQGALAGAGLFGTLESALGIVLLVGLGPFSELAPGCLLVAGGGGVCAVLAGLFLARFLGRYSSWPKAAGVGAALGVVSVLELVAWRISALDAAARGPGATAVFFVVAVVGLALVLPVTVHALAFLRLAQGLVLGRA